MWRQALGLIALIGIAGCAAQSNQPGPAANAGAAQQSSAAANAEGQGPTQAELAAYAGAHPYPASQQARTDLHAAAIVDPNTSSIKIYNFGTEPIRDANIWVNKAFVRHVNAIAPGSSISLRMSNLYNGVGQQFSASGDHVNTVQVEQDGNLATLWGPATQTP